MMMMMMMVLRAPVSKLYLIIRPYILSFRTSIWYFVLYLGKVLLLFKSVQTVLICFLVMRLFIPSLFKPSKPRQTPKRVLDYEAFSGCNYLSWMKQHLTLSCWVEKETEECADSVCFSDLQESSRKHVRSSKMLSFNTFDIFAANWFYIERV